jgi:hypothetical protein
VQVVQQLMAELATAQQQPPPYYGPQEPYGQQPYQAYNDPYGGQGYPPYPQQPPYGDPYGYGGQYPGPGQYGQPGSDSSMIPPGYDTGGGPFDGGGAMIPNDISQVFPGPGPMQASAQSPGPAAPNIISSDSLPDGSGPATTGESYGGGSSDEMPVPDFTPAPAVAVAKTQPIKPTTSQSVSVGPMQPPMIVQEDTGGQSPFADTLLPAGDQQDQPQLEPPTEIESVESWASDE